MTSSDGGGFAGNDPQPHGPVENARRAPDAGGPSPHDDDPVRLTPPADPWLSEASTSVLGEAPASLDSGAAPPADTVPLADPVPPADTVPFAGAAPLGDGTPPGVPAAAWVGGPPPRRRGRRATRWVLTILAACALLIAGVLAVDQFGSEEDSGASGPSAGVSAVPARTGSGQGQAPAAEPPAAPRSSVAATGGQPGSSADAATPGTSTGPAAPGSSAGVAVPGSSAGAAAPGGSASAGAAEVVYQVTASGSRNVGSVSYTDQDGQIIRLNGIRLPWRVAFPVGAQRRPRVLITQRTGGGDAGPVTCTVTVNGKLLSTTTADGEYAAPQCSGFG